MKLTINDLKIYTPAKDFELSKLFYSKLGFELTEVWAGDVDCRLGGAVFRLQNYYKKEWADNFMMLFGVDDARAWHLHAKQVIELGNFGSAKVAEPEEIDGAVICHVWDPSGILLIFIS